MKPKADIGIFIGYFESSTGFRIYNRRTKKIIEMIHVKFDELTSMASECNNSRPGLNCSNFKDSSEELNEIPLQQDLDNFFGPLYEEYYTPSASEVSNNSAANTLDDEDTSSPSSIIIEESDASAYNVDGPRYHLIEQVIGDPSKLVQTRHRICTDAELCRHVARERQKPKRTKDAACHKEKMLLCKQEEARFQLNAEQADWSESSSI
nr:hypothetical protein [Tanacetum cinerariifolium]